MPYPKLAALAVVLHKQRVLLVRRHNEPDAGLWGFPGGHVELGEAALDAAARELREETGVIAQPLRYLTNVDVIVPEGDTVRHHFLLAAVLCVYASGAPQARDDVSDARWWPVDRVVAGGPDFSAHVDEVVALAMRG